MTVTFAISIALTAFVAIGCLGFGFLLLSLVFGDLFDHHGVDAGGADGPGLMDTRALAVFLTTFGAVGAIAAQLGYGAGGAAALGLAGGVALGGTVYYFGRFLYRQQASSSVGAAQLIGRTAQVSTAIPAGGIGQISCRVGEERVEKIARARHGGELPNGALVRIEEFAGDAVIVSALDESDSLFAPGARRGIN